MQLAVAAARLICIDIQYLQQHTHTVVLGWLIIELLLIAAVALSCSLKIIFILMHVCRANALTGTF